MNILPTPFVIRTLNIEGDSLRSEHRPRPCGRLRKVSKGARAARLDLPQRDPVYSNPTTLFLSHLFSLDLSKNPPPSAPPFSPCHPILLFRRESFLTQRIPSFPPPSHPLRVPSTLSRPPTLCPAHRALLTIALTLSSSLCPSLFNRLANAKDRQRGIDREDDERGNERANGGAGSLWSCATRTSQPRDTVARQPRCPLKGSYAIDIIAIFPSSASRYLPICLLLSHASTVRSAVFSRFGVTRRVSRVRSPTPRSDRHSQSVSYCIAPRRAVRQS